MSSSVLRAYLTLLDYLVGRVLMPTASAGTVMRGHDNRVGSIPGISMPPNHRFSTYRLSPPPSAVYSIRDLLPVITTTFRRSSSSYPRQRERESLHGDERKKDDRWPHTVSILSIVFASEIACPRATVLRTSRNGGGWRSLMKRRDSGFVTVRNIRYPFNGQGKKVLKFSVYLKHYETWKLLFVWDV